MKINLRPHLLRRLKERKISKNYPKKIVQEPEREYFDTLTNHNIAIKKLLYSGKVRNMVVAYDIIKDSKELVTIYPIADKEIENKIRSGRWKNYEKN